MSPLNRRTRQARPVGRDGRGAPPSPTRGRRRRHTARRIRGLAGWLLGVVLAASPQPATLQAEPAPPASQDAPRTRSPHDDGVGDCSGCHSTAGWQQIHFDHSTTSFPLAQDHAAVTCTGCHHLARFDDLETDCASCHAEPHQQALGPDCAECHDATVWSPPPRFHHDATAFPLWGAHEAVDCVQCHADERTFQFVTPPALCMDCHETEFGRAAVAVHLTAGPDCETCHTLDEWSGGHDPAWFEIRGGHHDQPCAACHKRLPDYPSYTCAQCHQFSLRVEEHRGIDPDDARCLDCHSRGGFHD